MSLRAITTGAGLLMAAPAHAHGTLPGAGGFYAGAAHPFLVPEHLLALAALGLLIGGQARAGIGGVVIGLVIGLASGGAGAGTQAALGLALLAGVWLALALPVPGRRLGLLAVAVGIAVGVDTDLPIAAGGMAAAIAGAGVVVGTGLIVLNLAALASVAVGPTPRIALRIAGSWIAAAALMVLALGLRPLTGGA